MTSVIALVGISGVGKSYLLQGLADEVEFQRLSASDLIQGQRDFAGSSLLKDDLRSACIEENQRLMIAGFGRMSVPRAKHIVLDGHTLIDTPTGYIEVGANVFRQIGICRFIFLADSPNVIFARRKADESRRRPSRTVEQLAAYQDAALISAFQIALELDIPMTVITHNCRESIIACL